MPNNNAVIVLRIFLKGFEDPAVFRDAERVRASPIEQGSGIRGGGGWDELRKASASVGAYGGFSDGLGLPERPESDG